MNVTHRLHAEGAPAAGMPVAAIRYIKLGRGGQSAQDCFSKGEIGLGFDHVPHAMCASGQWDEVASLFRAEGKTAGVASNHTRELRDFYEQGSDTLWITIHGGKLWWAFAAPVVTWTDDANDRLPRRRKTIGPWRDVDRAGTTLQVQDLSTRLTSVGAYRSTICTIEREADYLIRKLNAQPEPLVIQAQRLRTELVATAHELIATLHHHDFEVLVDLLFAGSGWRRIGVLGESEADLDLLLEQVATAERAFVQVKSRASARVLDDYVDRFRSFPGATRMFFVCHSPEKSLLARVSVTPSDVDLWFGDKLAEKSIRAGLFDWLIDRAR